MTPVLFLSLLALAPTQDAATQALTSVELADRALQQNKPEKALEHIKAALEADPKNPSAWFLRGVAHGRLGKHKEAAADLSRALELDPKLAAALDLRGSENFKLGRIKESAADFDRYLKLKPGEFAGHWRRGITLYYAGRFDDGRKQFEGYEKVDTNDVENAVWHFLCVARKDGVEQARKSILTIGKDRRVPMMTVYELFQGKAKPDDVLKAVEEGNPDKGKRDTRLFYAHLYLGLYYEVLGDEKLALKHLQQAVALPRPHPYMWDVARVHRDLLQAKKEKK
jgi:lipoprotein NlpI